MLTIKYFIVGSAGLVGGLVWMAVVIVIIVIIAVVLAWKLR